MSPRRVWALASMALILAFVAGALAGAAWERLRAPEHRRTPAPRTVHEISISMQGRYGLTAQQTRQVETILARRRPRVDSIMASVRPQLRAAFDSTSVEIRAVLTPQQRVKFDREAAIRRHNFDRTTGARTLQPHDTATPR
jgi:Spy/CpxP family protein refolding chaperone